jgi:hypothetical protein
MNTRKFARRLPLLAAVLGGLLAAAVPAARPDDKPAKDDKPGPSVGNRDPLRPAPLTRLPIGSITPRGWLRAQLEAEAKGMTGHLEEISEWCKFDDSAWSDPKGKGRGGWEELPYWLKGYGDLGYVLKDEHIIKEAKRWIDAVLAGQDEDGWFGPRELKTSLDGKPDLWPNMIMLNVLQSYYEYGGDERVLPFMTKYFRWELRVPDADFLAGYWPKMRAGDNLESVYWLYNRTGDKFLLDLAAKIHKASANWTDGVPDWHGVNLTQGFREPAVYYIQSGDKKNLEAAERNYRTVMDQYGQFPGGGFAADEVCRKGYGDPRQGFETCSMVEFMHSFEMLTKITGDPVWADRCEEIAFNSLPAALTADQKALHYLTGANMARLDKADHRPGIGNGGCMLAYSPLAVYRCCQHNVSHGWPYFAEELWLADADKGLCASLYAPCEVEAKAGDGAAAVKIVEETDYPFGDVITFKFSMPKPATFPLRLRVPAWRARRPEVKINGETVAAAVVKPSYIVLLNEWKDGDVVTLRLPMALKVRTWEKNKGAVSVDYGPLTFALKVGEKYARAGGTDDWPEWEATPTTPWNYGLVLDPKAPAGSLELWRRDGPPPDRPFTPDAVPIEVKAKAKKIPNWGFDRTGLVGVLRQSPVRSDEPTETVTLIPMGAARLRIAAFPVIGDGPNAHDWPRRQADGAAASHVNPSDTLDALDDGELPANSADETIPRFTWWDHKGTRKTIDNTSEFRGDEWVQYDFAKPREISSAEVYWFDDTGRGQCRVPAGWRLVYKDGDEWKPVKLAGGAEYGVKGDQFNKVTFTAVKTTGLRLEVQLQKDFSGGILEWRVGP